MRNSHGDVHRGDGPRPRFEVAVIGAGISGIGMGIALRRAGIEDFVILERAGDIGGTWRDNTYPGVGVDIPVQGYQFSFALNPRWSSVYVSGGEIKSYVDNLTDRYGIWPHVRLHSEVTERVWDEAARLWRLRLAPAAHATEVTARYVVSAIGLHVDPKPVDIPGGDDFAGTTLHSACWDRTCDLTGKRVAVVGTGPSAVQLIPHIARRAARLDVYQRTPIWIVPKPNLPTPRVMMRLFERAPLVQGAVRRAAARSTELVVVDLAVNHQRVPFIAHGMTRLTRALWYRSQVSDPETRRGLTPDHGLGCKRPALSNTYLRTFNRPNVALVTDSIERITPGGVRTTDGREREADVLVLATGFRTAIDPESFRRTPVRGRDGFDLATFYTDHRLASYEGVSIPGLPNHFMMFGPYGWVGGAWHELVETSSAHIVRVIREARRRGATAVEVKPGPTARWTERMRRRLGTSVLATDECATANTFYYDHHGDTPYVRPISSAQARRAAWTFPLDDYAYTIDAEGGGRPGGDLPLFGTAG